MKKQTIHIFIIAGLISMVGIAARVEGSDSEKRQSEYETEIARLIVTLDMPKTEEKTKQAELDKAIAELVAIGDQVVEPIMDKIRRDNNLSFQHRSLQVLKEIGTPKAQKALLDIAVGSDPNTGTGFYPAARIYINTLQNRSDARNLLVSKKPDILFSALSAMRGVELDKELLEKLQVLTQSLDATVRTQAAGIIGADTGENFALEKVDALISSIKTAEKVKNGHKKFPNSRAIGTISDDVYFQIIDALSKTKGIDEYLKYKTNSLDGKTKYCAIIARANRGDSSVKQHLYKIINDPNVGVLRCSAVIAFNYIGTPDDVPFLRKLSLTDPLAVEPPQRCIVDPRDPLEAAIQNNKFYPVRFWAQQAIQWIEKKSKGKVN